MLLKIVILKTVVAISIKTNYYYFYLPTNQTTGTTKVIIYSYVAIARTSKLC